jgi:hypothetical protein
MAYCCAALALGKSACDRLESLRRNKLSAMRINASVDCLAEDSPRAVAKGRVNLGCVRCRASARSWVYPSPLLLDHLSLHHAARNFLAGNFTGGNRRWWYRPPENRLRDADFGESAVSNPRLGPNTTTWNPTDAKASFEARDIVAPAPPARRNCAM